EKSPECRDEEANSSTARHAPRSQLSWGSSLWSLPSLRFHSRGHFYQAFARFDLEVLQPVFGGPCHARAGSHAQRPRDSERRETFEMPRYQAEEEAVPLKSRAVIFE
ncbi:Slc9a8, partial [Symbiodinium sp. CCMP2456]